MKKFCESLKEHMMKIINFEKKKIIPLTSKEYESYLYQKDCHIFKKEFYHKFSNDKNYCKVKDHCHFTGKYERAPQNICNLKNGISKEIRVVFYT